MVSINFLSNIIKKFLILLIKIYQILIAKLLFKTQCRFIPSCSNYAIEAIEKKGLIKGIYFAILRILRCNPLNKNFGFDAVPKNQKAKKKFK